jgi:hypothetical protein
MGQSLPEDDRGTSEGAGLAVLVLFTVLVTASVGIGVLFVDQGDEGLDAEFSYDYFDEQGSVLITYESGQQFRADKVRIVGPGPNVTWDELGRLNASDSLEPGARVQLSGTNEYGRAIRGYHTVKLVWTANNNQTLLSQWNGSSA